MNDINRLPNLPGIDIESAMRRLEDDWDLYKSILISYRNKHVKSAKAIEDYLEENDLTSAAYLAHNLRGTSASLGADALSQQAAIIEKACSSGNKGEAICSLKNLCETLHEVMTGLLILNEEDETPSNIHSESKNMDCEKANALLEQLDNCLDVDMGKARDCLKALIEYIHCASCGASLDSLKHALNNFDVDLAKRNIQDIKGELLLDECKGCTAMLGGSNSSENIN